jgi:hypothetical protein
MLAQQIKEELNTFKMVSLNFVTCWVLGVGSWIDC